LDELRAETNRFIARKKTKRWRDTA
jgi:hypothetical protein